MRHCIYVFDTWAIKENHVEYVCILTRSLIHAMIHACISARVQGRNISSEHTSKVGISTSKCIALPSSVLRSWRIEVLPVLFELFRQDSFMSELFNPSAFRPYLHRRCEEGSFEFQTRQEYAILYIYECSFNPIVAEKPGARICLLRDVPLPFIGSANFELLQAMLHTRKGWDFVNPKRRKQIHHYVFNSTNAIVYSPTISRTIKQVSFICDQNYFCWIRCKTFTL